MGKMTQLYKQTFSDISSFEKLQKPTNSEKIDKSKILELLVRELNPLEQYSSKELLEELTRRASKKRRLIKAVIQILTKVIITRWKGIFNESVIN